MKFTEIDWIITPTIKLMIGFQFSVEKPDTYAGMINPNQKNPLGPRLSNPTDYC